MKKFTRVVLAGIAVTTLLSFTGDNTFEGVVTYTVNASSDNPQMAQMMAGGSGTMVTYIKGNKKRTDFNMGMMVNRKTIVDMSTKQSIMLMDMMGNKYELKTDLTKEKNNNPPTIKELDSTKQIAGYTCHAASISVTDPRSGDKQTFTIYYTDQLPYDADNGMYKGLKGFPLQFGMMQQGITFKMSATKVEKKSLSDTTFNVPSGYKVFTSREDLQKAIQEDMQNGGGN